MLLLPVHLYIYGCPLSKISLVSCHLCKAIEHNDYSEAAGSVISASGFSQCVKSKLADLKCIL